MTLWAKALPRPFRLHDTRHTTATLLLAAGVDLYAVARILRHTDPKVTFDTYAQLVPCYLHAQIDRLKLGRLAAPVLPGAQIPADRAEAAPENDPEIEAIEWRALLDSNQWPSASECEPCALSGRPSESHSLAFRELAPAGEVPNVPARPADPGNFAAPVLHATSDQARAAMPSFITPQQAAERFGVCRATIYKLCARDELPHVRIGSSVRLVLADVIAEVARPRSAKR